MSILDKFCKRHGYKPRDAQTKVLQELEAKWDDYDVFVIVVPTAGGKTYISDCIAQYAAFEKDLTTNVIVSDNNLLGQAEKDFHSSAKFLYAQKFYKCTWKGLDDKPVNGTRADCPFDSCRKRFTNGCPYTRALNGWKQSKIRVSNYWMPLAQKQVKAGAVVIDECHLFSRYLSSLAARRMWHSEFNYPLNADSYLQLRGWVEKELARLKEAPPTRGDDEYQHAMDVKLLAAEIFKDKQDFCVVSTEAEKYGQMQPCLELRPIEVRSALPMVIPREVKKLFLLSATMSKHDVDELGLLGRRVCYLNVPSPIPPERRPVKIRPLLSNRSVDGYKDAKNLLIHIEELASRYPNDKGMVHLTYALAKHLKDLIAVHPELLTRSLFHDKYTKRAVLKEFLEAPPESGKILFGCGLNEGLDLKDDLARFNIIAKILWPSLEAPENVRLLENNPDSYAWRAARGVVQAAGRVCRTETDYGETLILDSSFKRIPEHLLPAYFREAMVWLQ